MPPQPQKQDTGGNPAATPPGAASADDAGADTGKQKKAGIGTIVMIILVLGIIIGGVVVWFIFRTEDQIEDERFSAVPPEVELADGAPSHQPALRLRIA